MSILDQIAGGTRTSPLDVVKAGTQGQMDAAKLADASLSRKIKQSEYDDYLEGATMRRQKRDEFTSEEGQEARATSQEAGQSADEQKIATAKKQEFWDLANFTMDEGTTQEDYNGIYDQIDPVLRDKANLTGTWKLDREKVRKVLDTTKDSIKHVQDLEKIGVKAAADAKGTSKLHKPSAPPLMKDPASARMYVGADPELADLARTWSQDTDAANIDALSNKVMIRANSLMSESYRKATILSSTGQAWNQLQVGDAMKVALEKEKSLLVQDDEGSEISFLPVGEAVQQRTNWIAKQGESYVKQYPNMRAMTPGMFQKRMDGIYEDYMLRLYQTKRLNINENASFNQPSARRSNTQR